MEDENVQEQGSEKEAKKGVSAWLEEHPKIVFWSRFVSWSVFAWALPFAFIVWRFKLFQKIQRIQINGWGLLAIIITAIFAFTIIKYIKMAFSKRYSLIGQILSGFCKIIIPLLTVTAILISVKESIELMIQVMVCVTACEAIAIPLNPLPEWAYNAQKEVRVEERKETADYIIDSFFKRKKEEENGDKK